jgi:hypothetical protein
MNWCIFHALDPVGGSGNGAGSGTGTGTGTGLGLATDLTTCIGLITGVHGVHGIGVNGAFTARGPKGVDSTRGNTIFTGFEDIIERMGVECISGMGARTGIGGGLTSTDDFVYTLLFLEPYLFIYKISTET